MDAHALDEKVKELDDQGVRELRMLKRDCERLIYFARQQLERIEQRLNTVAPK